ANNITFRYNSVSNNSAESLFFDQSSPSPGGGNYFYGNIFHNGPVLDGSAIETKQGFTWGDFHIYNNTFIGYPKPCVYLRGTSTANNEVRNNIFWNGRIGIENVT